MSRPTNIMVADGALCAMGGKHKRRRPVLDTATRKTREAPCDWTKEFYGPPWGNFIEVRVRVHGVVILYTGKRTHSPSALSLGLASMYA